MRARLILDLGLIVLMLVAFAYQLTDNLLHEIVGTAFVTLTLVHNLLSRRWYATIGKGKRTARRIVTTVLNLLLLSATLVLVVSGLANSHDLFPFLRTKTEFLDRRVHAMAAYWVLFLASLHLGLHWSMVTGALRTIFGVTPPSRFHRFVWRAVVVFLIGFGLYAFFERDIPYKLAGLFSFDYWDFKNNTFGYFARYIAIISVGVCLTHCGLQFATHLWKRRHDNL